MPSFGRIGPFRLFIYSSDCTERRHIHIQRDKSTAKYWIDPEVILASNSGFKRNELNRHERIVVENRQELIRFWNEFCTGS